ncbi:hypothetical protein ASPTUDRAFT_635105 [Aspergillus tubingensis CBS 134.48]|uniref:Uncharacterized protein n=1 Tax=Aspergillus tubingensis (strain CBS 134.48) TaxID=767770 RepID=A0A1L9N444_ASPTC|nr:hypothetical protein ASPTUDRAFT_635105 [Aspergillus tubingensis CBS 134.48]
MLCVYASYYAISYILSAFAELWFCRLCRPLRFIFMRLYMSNSTPEYLRLAWTRYPSLLNRSVDYHG